MKITLLFLICLATASVRSFGAGTITPGGGTIAGGSGAGGIGSNTVYNMIQTYAPTNGGITSAQAATQINTSNTTVFANTYIPQLNGLGNGLAVTNGKDIHLSSEGTSVRRVITSGDVNGGSIDSEGSIKFAAGVDPNFTIYGGENNNMQFVSDGDISFNGSSYTFLNGAVIGGNGSLIKNLIHSSTVSAGSGTTVTLSENSDGSTNYQIAVTGSGTGTLLPPNALGVLTNNGSGSTNWSTSIPGAWIGTATLPATTADSTWPKRTNYLAFDWAGNGTTTNAGNALVLNGFDSFGSPMFKGTNWPTGGSTPNGLVTNAASANVIVTNAGVNTTITSNSVTTGTFNANGGNSNFMGGFSYVQTNVAPFNVLTTTGGESSWSAGVLYTNRNTRALLFMDCNLTGGSALATTVTINYTNSGVAHQTNPDVPVSQAQTIFPICIPLDPNATFKITTSVGSGGSAILQLQHLEGL